MRQKKLINILIVIVSSAILLVLWFNGLNWIYAKLVNLGVNICLLFSSHTSVHLKMDKGVPTYIVKTLIEGKKGSYPQEAALILLPFVLILTWQILLFFNLQWKKARRSAIENILIFYVLQVIYLVLLTGYYNSPTVKFIYNLFMDSFYIFGLFLIAKDTFRYRLIGFQPGSQKAGSSGDVSRPGK
jgi:hypothetical protein